MSERVMVGMSGGVDSSVAAYLLMQDGYDVSGVTMSLCGDNSHDVRDAESVARKLNIKHFSADMSMCFKKSVVADFIKCYKEGGTPNPCVVCNREVKFGEMLEYALSLGMDYIATGHYAIIDKSPNNRFLLRKAKDESKDQTYFLYSLNQHQLAHSLFPLGNYEKDEIRAIAENQGLVTARKRDSQDICFVPDGDYASFIEQYTGEYFPKGDFIDHKGNRLGEHNGMIRYTIGQRKGLGIALGKPAFVCSKNVENNTVVLGDNEDLYTCELTANKVNLISCESIDAPMRVCAKVRYNQKEQPASVVPLGGDRIKIVFDQPQRAVSKGQSVVFYDGDIVVGGGIIE